MQPSSGGTVVYRTRLHWLLFATPVLFTVIVLLPIAWLLTQKTWSQNLHLDPLALALLILIADVYQTTKF